MTEPMSDERIVEIGRCFLQLGFIPDSVGQELLDEVVRTRDIPPDVQEAMEVFIASPTVSSDSKWIEIMHKKQAASGIIAAWAVSHFRKDGA